MASYIRTSREAHIIEIIFQQNVMYSIKKVCVFYLYRDRNRNMIGSLGIL